MSALNVMLSFLSTVRVNKDGEVDKTGYEELLEDGLGPTQITNESAARWLINDLLHKKTSDEGMNNQLDYYIAIASEEVRTKNVKIVNGPTHFCYFVNRMQEIFNKTYGLGAKDASKTVIPIIYDEKSKQDRSLGYVLEIINKIKDLQQSAPNGEVNLYLDLTGGLRDANMLMLIITRMLAYDEKIHVREVLYSNYIITSVQNISNTYNLLNLVAGISEFVNFGSMKALNAYFKSIPDNLKKAELVELLDAMDNFAKMAMLCRYGEFKVAIKRLKNALDAFYKYCSENKGSITSPENLISNFIYSIDQKYALLFEGEQDNPAYDLKLIRWCYENNYIQQAMTLITERIPEYLFGKNGVLYLSDKDKNKIYEQFTNETGKSVEIEEDNETGVESEWEEGKENDNKIKKSYLTFATWLMFESHSTPFYNKEKFLSKCKSHINTQFDNIRGGKGIDESIQAKIDKCIKKANCKEYVSAEEISNCFKEFFNYYKGVDTSKIAVIDDVSRNIFINQYFEKDCPEYKKLPLREFLKRYTQNTENAVKLLEKFFHEKNIGNYSHVKSRVLRGEICGACDERMLLDILYTYYELKEERNAVNHAHNEKEKITLEELLKKIEFLITGLEKIENERKIKDADGAVEEFTAQ